MQIRWPIRHTLALRGGDNATYLFDEISTGDIEELIKNGCLSQAAEAQGEKYLQASI